MSFIKTTFIILKTQTNILNCIVALFFLTACYDQHQETSQVLDNPSSFKWISGNYQLNSDFGNYTEKWKQEDSCTYFGFGCFLDNENHDTLFRQRMKLQQTPEGVFMYFNVKNQNDNKDVEFRLTKQERKLFTFENPFRDYPSIITYKILSDTIVNVVMFGFKNGKEKKEDFIITK